MSTLGNELSYGVVMAEVEVGPRRVDTMKTLLARGMHLRRADLCTALACKLCHFRRVVEPVAL